MLMKADIAAEKTTGKIGSSASVAETPDTELNTFKESNRKKGNTENMVKEKELASISVRIGVEGTLSNKYYKKVNELGSRIEEINEELSIKQQKPNNDITWMREWIDAANESKTQVK